MSNISHYIRFNSIFLYNVIKIILIFFFLIIFYFFFHHPFHLVSPSPWPLFTSISLLSLTTCSAFKYIFAQGFEFGLQNPPKPHVFTSLCLQSSTISSGPSDPEGDDDESNDSRDTEELADRNESTLEMIGEYKAVKNDLDNLKPISKKPEEDITQDDKNAWNKVSESYYSDLNPEISYENLKK